MTRNEARDRLMQMIFQMDAQNDFSAEARDKYFENYPVRGKQAEYITEVHEYLMNNIETIDKLIDESSNGWKTGRMAKMDLAIVRLAIAEIRAMDDVPSAVAINEAVNLAEIYGTENSPKFINGLLGKAVELL